MEQDSIINGFRFYTDRRWDHGSDRRVPNRSGRCQKNGSYRPNRIGDWISNILASETFMDVLFWICDHVSRA